jgi:hypothetical protein
MSTVHSNAGIHSLAHVTVNLRYSFCWWQSMYSTHSWIFCRSSRSDGGLFLYKFCFKQPQEKGLVLGLNIVFNNTSRLHSRKRHVRRPAVLKPLLGYVTCACPHTASVQSYQYIHPPVHLYRIPSQLVLYFKLRFEPLFHHPVKCIQHSAVIMRHLFRRVRDGVVYNEILQA